MFVSIRQPSSFLNTLISSSSTSAIQVCFLNLKNEVKVEFFYSFQVLERLAVSFEQS